MNHRHAEENLNKTNPWMGIYLVRDTMTSPLRLVIHSTSFLKWVVLTNNSVGMIFTIRDDLLVLTNTS